MQCRVGCCLIPQLDLDRAEMCGPCGASGFQVTPAGAMVCGACHGFGVLTNPPRWMIDRYSDDG